MKMMMISDKSVAESRDDFRFTTIVGSDPFQIETYTKVSEILGPESVRISFICPEGKFMLELTPGFFESFVPYEEKTGNKITFIIDSDEDILKAIEKLLRMRR